MGNALKKQKATSLIIGAKSSVYRSSLFDDEPKSLLEAVHTETRPIEVLIPKRQDRIEYADCIYFQRCIISVPKHVHCSERVVFHHLREDRLLMPRIGFTAEALLQALPGIIESSYGINKHQRNFFLLRDRTALMVWAQKRTGALAARRAPWRDAFETCHDNDHIFIAA